MIQAVLFDMDGVLAFTEQYYNSRRLEYLAGQGIVLDEREGDWTGVHDDEAWERCVPEDRTLRERLRRGYYRYANEHPTPWRELVNSQAHGTLSRLHESGVRTAICSSSPRESIEKCVEQAGIAPFVDFAISGDECDEHKPHPEIYLRAMDELSVRPVETVVVEDSPVGIRAGKAAGALVCALRQPAGVLLDQSEADILLESLSDVVGIVV